MTRVNALISATVPSEELMLDWIYYSQPRRIILIPLHSTRTPVIYP